MELFRLLGTIAIDNSKAKSELDATTDKAEESSTKLQASFSKVGSAAVKMGATVAKAGAALTAAAGTAVVALTKAAVQSYAEYEQLVGGVETLFKDSADKVQEYAANAYKTAGMSANEYMETVTSFSASLLQSLGGDTAAAAEVADMAITDMADNANKMGTSMESIQNAYQGFAKQNYTMLDNLKLGYGGTKEEMERLLADAEKFSGVKYDISNLNDVYSAIHVIQEEMGITGTTAKEASQTISGSVAAMGSAWKNLVTGIADDNADFDSLINNFVESVSTAGNNILPRVEVALNGAAQLIDKLFPVIAERIPAILMDVLPKIVSAAVSIVESLVSGLRQNMGSISQTAFEVIMMLVSSILSMLPDIIAVGLDLIVALAQGIAENIESLTESVIAVIFKIIDVLTDEEQITSLLEAAFTIMGALATGLISAIPEVVKKVPTIVKNLVKAFTNSLPNIVDVGKNIVQSLFEGIESLETWIKDKISAFADKIFGGIGDKIKGLFGGGDESTTTSSTTTTSSVKAHAAGGVLTKPTIFGFTPATNTYHLGGEAGDEAVAPIETLKQYIAEAVVTANAATEKANNNYNFTFNSPKAMSEAEANRQAKRAFRDFQLGF